MTAAKQAIYRSFYERPCNVVPLYHHTPLFPLGPDKTPYRKLDIGGVKVEKVMGKDMLVIEREALRALSEAAFTDINHLLRPAHLKQLRKILDDPEASDNDKFVAYDFLKNANIAAGGVLPMCQDTGTAIIMGKKGRMVFTAGDDEAALAEGARDAYLKRNLRYSQLAPISMFEEKNTKSNMPAQVEIYAEGEDAYKLLFIAKGGGSANKAFLFQATPSILTHDRMLAFLKEKVLTLGTAACPPYHLAIVIGGTSAELTMKTVKLASTKYLDELPTKGSEDGHAFRDLEMEAEVLKMTQSTGVGAQFGGKYFCHDVRVIRLPRHGASLPIGLGVSCAADRQALGKITKDGVFLEELEHHPAQYLPGDRPGKARRAGGESRPAPADEGHSCAAVEISGEDAALADRHHDRCARPRACQIARAAGGGEGDARLFQEPSDLLRGAGEDTAGLCVRLVRPDDGGADGQLYRPVPGCRRLDDLACQGQPLGAGARRVQEARRLLPGLDRRQRREARRTLHQESRGARISRARHGSDLEDRGRGFSGLHRHRRQGQ